jgi:superfamily II DNA or RNA helicase/HKD family nuclease
MALERNPTLEITRAHLNDGAARARSGASEKVRERVFVSHAVKCAVRDFFENTFGIATRDGRSADDKYTELLDVNDFSAGDWSLEVRVLTNVKDVALYVPTLPLIVGFVSDFYIFVKTDSTLGVADVLGFTHSNGLGDAELTPNGLMAILPLEDLQSWDQLRQNVGSAKQEDLQQLALFDEWQTRASNLSAMVERLLTTEEAFEPEQVKLLVGSFRDEILRVYGRYAAPVAIQAIYEKLAGRFNLSEPIRAHPDSPLVFASPEKEKSSAATVETERKYFQDDLGVPRRAGLYHYLIESDEAFDAHRRLKSVLDRATGGNLQASKRRREHIRRTKESRSAASEGNPIPPPVTDPAERAELDAWFAEFEPREGGHTPASADLIYPIDPNTWDAFPFKTEYRTGYDDLVRDFYHPALAGANEYWRAVGFFSSSSLEAVGRPLGDFVARGGRMRLITSVELSEQDYDAIAMGTKTESVVEERLLERIRKDFENPVGKGSELLLRLLEAGCLEIKVAVPNSGPGIFHEKVGVFLAANRFIAFSGSMNESRFALENNYECVDVFTSWDDSSRAESKKLHFERLWNNAAPGVTTLTFPEAAKSELIRISGSGKSAPSQPGQSAPIRMWRHQEEAIATFLREKRGVLEMATGTGKTFTAVCLIRQLVDSAAVNSVIVSCKGTDLLDQWSKELYRLATSLGSEFRVLRHYGNSHDRDEYTMEPEHSILAISRSALEPVLRNLDEDQKRRTLIVHDEVHGFGSPSNVLNLEGLSEGFIYRLGLSATPDREYDEAGNAFIERNVGPIIYRFPLQEAIRRGILCEFDYFPLEYALSEDDRERIKSVYKQRAGREHAGNPMSDSEFRTALARVYKVSRQKIPLLVEFLKNHPSALDRSIVFVAEREYGEEVLPFIHDQIHDFHTYYADDDQENLVKFAKGEINCLITCHRLSEGIDVRSIKSVILMASDRSRLETIQRIGRCLRFDPSQPNKRAMVVDFIREQDPDGEQNADQERRDWLQSISDVKREMK